MVSQTKFPILSRVPRSFVKATMQALDTWMLFGHTRTPVVLERGRFARPALAVALVWNLWGCGSEVGGSDALPGDGDFVPMLDYGDTPHPEGDIAGETPFGGPPELISPDAWSELESEESPRAIDPPETGFDLARPDSVQPVPETVSDPSAAIPDEDWDPGQPMD